MTTVGKDILNRNRPSKDEIATYFTELDAEYGSEWAPEVHDAAMHFGYFDAEHTELGPAMNNMKRILADMVDIGPGDRVLEAGCGLGETSTWLAMERGAEVVGINITESQLEKARALARERDVADQVEFRYDDYTEMETIPDDSFDVVWGLESVCYAEDKREVLEQAERVLDDDGRILVGDWYMTERELTDYEHQIVEYWLEGWKIPNLAHIDDFEGDLADLGFENINTHDATENIIPSAEGLRCQTKRMVTWPIAKMLNLVGLVSYNRAAHERGCYYQHKVYDNDLVIYGLVSAQK